MKIETIVSIVALMLVILGHAGASIWWASKMSTILSNIKESLDKMSGEFEKRDATIQRMWNRIDELRDMIK